MLDKIEIYGLDLLCIEFVYIVMHWLFHTLEIAPGAGFQ